MSTVPAGGRLVEALLPSTDVVELAELRWRPEATRPRLEQDLWDFDGWADAATQMTPSQKRFRFDALRNPLWRGLAKELVLIWLRPGDPELADARRRVRRKPTHPHTCHTRMRELTRWLNWLTDRGISSLTAVTQHDCEAFLQDYSHILDDCGHAIRPKKPITLQTTVLVMQHIARYQSLLSVQGGVFPVLWTRVYAAI